MGLDPKFFEHKVHWFSIVNSFMLCLFLCAVVAIILLLFAILNSFYAQRGATATSFVISYLITVIAGGYEGGRVFRMFGGQHWKRTMVYQCLFMPGIVFISFAVINT